MEKDLKAPEYTFGNAYVDDLGYIVYPLPNRHLNASWIPVAVVPKPEDDTKDITYGDNEPSELTRSPSHDLIPRSDVDALIEALEWYIDNDYQHSDGGYFDNGRDKAKQALSAFKSKYGDKHE